jgi:hypothetical protein
MDNPRNKTQEGQYNIQQKIRHKPTCNKALRGGIYPSDLKIERSARIQIVKYQAFVLWHNSPTSNTNNAVVGDLKPARSELRHFEVTWI